ncbi:MAG: hypothetical protein DCF13_05750 [Flavobacteriaceae bacterium]|nr:MAG: hypothetical protein DCF13_05750 [Flavobacteriaceae bacterium]
MKINKQIKLALLLCFITIVTFAQTAQRGEQAPPVIGVGVVVKKNPGGGASKAVVTNENGQANITIKEAGNYTIALTQTQGKTAGEPLMGIVVKFGCNVCPKKMTVTTNEKGEAQLKDLEKGDYTFTVEQPVAEHRGHVTLIKKNEQPDVTAHSITQTAERGEQAPPVIGVGVVVKRNPGGGASKAVVTNEKGQANITIKEAGNYTIALTQTQGKTAGEPIPGIIVKGGKNPGGKMMTVTTNEKGEADLNDLEKGDYTFTVEQPVASQTTTDYVGHVTLIKKNEGKPNTNMTISDDNTSTDYVGHVTLLRFSQLYLGGGLIMPSSTTKEGANSVNGIDFNIGYNHPIWAWEKSMISLGINAELGYRQGIGSHNLDNQYTIYNLAGQSQLPTTTERGIGPPGKEQGFRGAAGLQMNVHLGDKFTLSPILNAGYLSTTQNSFSVDETIYLQGNEFTYTLLAQKESKTSGLGILPKLRMTYNITPRIGIWLEGNYTIGPKIKTEVTTFAPEPSAGVDGTYTLSQFENGAYTTTKRETSYSAVGVNGGVVFSLGKSSKSDYVGHVTLIKKNGKSKEVFCPAGSIMINGRCIPETVINSPWLDKETGLIKYFEYTEDYTISNNELTQQLGVEELTIEKGKYTIERNTSEKGKDKDGAVLLKLKNPIKTTAKEIIVETYNPRGKNCNDFGNNCFYVTEPLNKADVKSKVSITPIVVNGVANQIKVTYRGPSGPPGKQAGF